MDSRETTDLSQSFAASRDARLMAETVQAACRELIAGAPALVRHAELSVADLISVASMIDELAFQVHVSALEGSNTAFSGASAGELQKILLDGASIAAAIQSCMKEASSAAESLRRRLHEQADLALRLGRRVAHTPDTVVNDDLPIAP